MIPIVFPGKITFFKQVAPEQAGIPILQYSNTEGERRLNDQTDLIVKGTYHFRLKAY